ncbi:MAG TPA: response regulator [Chloroflexota bacterium]|nr:response regulator [Chloroflexota bacterium]
MRVLLADGDPDVRGALRLVLTHDLGMQVIGEPADATNLRAQVLGLRPDLLLLDWALVGDAAADTIAGLRALAPGLRIVILCAHPETRPQAFAAGADAFVSKTEAPAQLLATLRALPGHGPARCADDTTGGREAT